jgi:hypothetical protein
VEVGDLGGWEDEGGGSVRASLRDNVTSDKAGKSGSQATASKEIFKCRVTALMREKKQYECGPCNTLHQRLAVRGISSAGC